MGGVGDFLCVNVEGGSSANFPGTLRVFESPSELESVTVEDFQMCGAGVFSDFPLSVQGSHNSQDEGDWDHSG